MPQSFQNYQRYYTLIILYISHSFANLTVKSILQASPLFYFIFCFPLVFLTQFHFSFSLKNFTLKFSVWVYASFYLSFVDLHLPVRNVLKQQHKCKISQAVILETSEMSYYFHNGLALFNTTDILDSNFGFWINLSYISKFFYLLVYVCRAYNDF